MELENCPRCGQALIEMNDECDKSHMFCQSCFLTWELINKPENNLLIETEWIGYNLN